MATAVMKWAWLTLALLCCVYVHVDGHECETFLMDSLGYPVMDMQPLKAMRFDSVSISMCEARQVEIQIWRYNYQSFELVYTTTITPEPEQIGDGFFEVDVPGFELWDTDYVALKSEAGRRIPVPFVDTPEVPATNKYRIVNLPGREYQLQDMVERDFMDAGVGFRRSFIPKLYFCFQGRCRPSIQTNPQYLSEGGVPGPPGPDGDPGPKGAPGEQGAAGSKGEAGQSVPCPTLDDPEGSEQWTSPLTDVAGKTEDILRRLEDVNQRVDHVINQANLVTGSCPVGFTAAEYGVGYCYLLMEMQELQFGLAGIECYNRNASLMLSFDNAAEERFVAGFLYNHTSINLGAQPPGTTVEVWTGGMYSPGDAEWIWYQEGREDGFVEVASIRSTRRYQNWGPNEPGDQAGPNDCIMFRVERNGDHAWYSRPCPTRYMFVCKQAKKCN